MTAILGKRLLFITAHPDDESYLVAGTINENHKAGGKSFVLCATLGERGKTHLTGMVTANKLKQLRKTELATASEIMHVDKLMLAHLPDGELQSCINKLRDRVLHCIKKIKPDCIISFAKDGVTAHRDHITTGQVARALAQQCTIPFVAICAAPELVKGMEALKKRRSFGVYEDAITHQLSNLKIKIDSNIKMQALLCHASQMPENQPFHNIPPKAAQQMLRYEYFFVK